MSATDGLMRTVTGVLSSRITARDIKIDGFTLGVNGSELIQDCSIELTIGRRYVAPSHRVALLSAAPGRGRRDAKKPLHFWFWVTPFG